MYPMHFVHLLLNLIIGIIALLRRERAKLRIQHLRLGKLVLDGRVNLIADELIETMRRWRKSPDVFVVKRTCLCTIQDLAITIVEHDIHGVRFASVWEFVPIKPYFVAGKGSLQFFLGAVCCSILEIGRNTGKSVLEERLLYFVRVTFETELLCDTTQTAEVDGLGNGPTVFMDTSIDNKRVKPVCQLPGIAVLFAIGDIPMEGKFPACILSNNIDIYVPSLREIMDRESREDRLSPDDIEG